MPGLDNIKVYTSVVRLIVEYACQLWHTCLKDYQVQLLESIHEKAMFMSYPRLNYEDALSVTGLSTLSLRRHELCGRLFTAAQDPSHKLFPLLPYFTYVSH